ncbi:MAG: hypothetical protein IJH34_17910 [Romboutsia sp.]|nr:hypothetical protein [Romboutsia sp.]
MKELKNELAAAISEKKLDWKLLESPNGIKVGIDNNTLLLVNNEKENKYTLVCMVKLEELKDVDDMELIELGLYFCSVDYDNLPTVDNLMIDMNKMFCLCNCRVDSDSLSI